MVAMKEKKERSAASTAAGSSGRDGGEEFQSGPSVGMGLWWEIGDRECPETCRLVLIGMRSIKNRGDLMGDLWCSCGSRRRSALGIVDVL